MTKQISKAPEPITPLRGVSSYISKPPTILPADYETWLKADLWTLERGILLLLNVETLPESHPSWMGGPFNPGQRHRPVNSPDKAAVYDDFMKIWGIAKSSVQIGKLPIICSGPAGAQRFNKNNPLMAHEVSPSDFLAWAVAKGYSIPAELEAIESMTQAVSDKRKKLKPFIRETNEGLLLIKEITEKYKVEYLDDLPAAKAWGKIISKEFTSDLIKHVIGTRKTASIELNGGDTLTKEDFLEKYRKRFKDE